MKRIYHTWDRWECYPAGFYENQPPAPMTPSEAIALYAELLRDPPRFEAALKRVLAEWPRSCEHYLSNDKMNRIAWLGQASMCIATGVPACFRGGFNLLTEEERRFANLMALEALNAWLEDHGEPKMQSLDDAASKTEANLY